MMSDLYDPAFPTGHYREMTKFEQRHTLKQYPDDEDEDSAPELRKSDSFVDMVAKEKTGTMVIAESCTGIQKSSECDQFTNNELQNKLIKSTHLLQEVNNFNGLLPMISTSFQGKVDQLPVHLGMCNMDSENSIPVNRDHSYSRKICPESSESVRNNSGNDKSACDNENSRSVSPPLVKNVSDTMLFNGDVCVEAKSAEQEAGKESICNLLEVKLKTIPVNQNCDVENCSKSRELDESKMVEISQEISQNGTHSIKKKPEQFDPINCQETANNDVKDVPKMSSDCVTEVSLVTVKQESLEVPQNENIKDELPEMMEKELPSTQDNSKKKSKRGVRNSVSEASCSALSEELPVRRSSRIRSLEERKEKKGKGSKERAKKEDKDDKKSIKSKQEPPPKDLECKKEDVESSETVREELHSETSSSNETFATVDKEDRKEEDADSKATDNKKENACLDSPVPSVSPECKGRQSPALDAKREEDFMIKPEKVKSRWRRNSELERGSVGLRTTSSYLHVELPDARTGLRLTSSYIHELPDAKIPSLQAKENTIPEEPLVIEPTPPPVVLEPVPVPIPVPPAPAPVQPIILPIVPVGKLPHFDLLEENLYLFERKRSKSKKEVRRMVCDCVLMKEELEQGFTGCGEDCLNRLLMIECGSRCALGDSCGNKRFQKKQCAKTEPFKTEKKGWGLRTLEDISVGTFVMEYVGEVLSYPDFRQRVKQYAREKNDHYYFMALKSDEIIDATCKGSMSRFINHSCEPNCETQKWTVNGELRIGFFTTTRVTAGQELTFDYQFQRYGREAQKCHCESSKCRGYIGEDKQISLKSNKVQKKRRAVEEKKREALEDLTLQDELDKLSEKGGLKNQEDTLMLARLMVRAEEVNTRVQLLDIIQNTLEPACMRLFLDYHGLPLIWSWMVDVNDGAWELKTKILQVLALLPIPNKTMLLDSKVMNVVQRWALQVQQGRVKEKDEQSSSSPPSGATTPGHGDSVENLTSLENVQPAKRTKHEDSISDSDGCEVAPSSSEETERTLPRESVECVASCSSPPVLPATNGVADLGKRDSVERTGSDASDRVSSTVTSGEEVSSPSGRRTDDASDAKSDEESGDAMDEFGEKKDLNIPNLAAKLLESWTLLKEVFRIPRLERQKRKEDELAAGQQEGEWRRDWECETRDRYRDRKRGRYRDDFDWDCDRKVSKEERNHRYSSDEHSDTKSKRAPLLPTPPQLSKHERRQLFAMEVQQRDQEEAMRRQQEELEMSLLEDQQQQQELAAAILEYPPQTYLVDPNAFQQPQLFDPASVAFIPQPMLTGPPPMLSDAQLPVPMTSSPVLPVNSPLEGQVNQLRSSGLLPLGSNFVDVCTSSIPLPPPQHITFQDPNQPPHVYQQPPPVGMVYAANPPSQVPYAATPVPTTIVDVVPPVFPSPLQQPVVASPSPIPTIPPATITPIPNVPLLAPSQSPIAPVSSIPAPNSTCTIPSVAPNFVPSHQPQPYIAHQSTTSLYYVQSNGAVVTLADQSQMPGPIPLVHVAVAQAPVVEETRVPSPPKTKPTKLPPSWRTAKDDEGNVYYYHSVTRQTQWDPPTLDDDDEEESNDMDLGTPTFDEPKVHKYGLSPQEGRSSSHKRHSKKKTTTAAADTSSEVAKKIKELFRTKMSSYIVQCLNPYRKPDCRVGRISCTEDFKHLARKLTHFVMAKELKHCKNVEDLECNENVKHKAKEFVFKYMSRYGAIYRKDKGSPKESY